MKVITPSRILQEAAEVIEPVRTREVRLAAAGGGAESWGHHAPVKAHIELTP